MKSEFKLVSLLKNRKPFQKLYIVELYLFLLLFLIISHNWCPYNVQNDFY